MDILHLVRLILISHLQKYREMTGGVPRLTLPQDKYEEAEPLYRRALSIAERTLGKDHPVYSTRLGDLAQLLQQQVRARTSSFLDVCSLGHTPMETVT